MVSIAGRLHLVKEAISRPPAVVVMAETIEGASGETNWKSENWSRESR